MEDWQFSIIVGLLVAILLFRGKNDDDRDWEEPHLEKDDNSPSLIGSLLVYLDRKMVNPSGKEQTLKEWRRRTILVTLGYLLLAVLVGTIIQWLGDFLGISF